jgi:hypothetical protein
MVSKPFAEQKIDKFLAVLPKTNNIYKCLLSVLVSQIWSLTGRLTDTVNLYMYIQDVP